MAEWAYLSDPDHREIRKAVHQIYTARAEVETSTMSMGVFMARAREVLGQGTEENIDGAHVLQAQDERGQKRKN